MRSTPRETPEEAFDRVVLPVYTAIGAVASNWSHFERFIDEAIWAVASIKPSVGACMTANIQSARYKLFTLAALLELHKHSGLAQRTKAFVQKTDTLSKKRNRIVHDPVSMREHDNIALRSEATAERILVYRSEPVDMKVYRKQATEIFDLSEEFLIFQAEIFSRHPPLQ